MAQQSGGTPLAAGFQQEKRALPIATLLTALFAAGFLSLPHMGFMLLIVALPIVLWLPWSAYAMIKVPGQRHIQIRRIVIWLAAITVVIGVHTIRHHAIRNHANDMAHLIERYIDTHDHCPETLNAIGFTSATFKEKIGIQSGYSCKDGKPLLIYVVPYMVFDTYHYSFEQRRWDYFAD